MFSKFIKIFFLLSLLSTLAISFLAFYPGLPPNVSFTEFNVKPNLELVNELLVNQKLNFVERLFENKIHGPEAFAIYNDELYTTLLNGDIIKVDKNDKMTKVRVRDENQHSGPTRPLGITFDQDDGTMYVCDAFRGIWMLKNEPNASVEYLVKASDKIAGKEAKVFNALALAKNGDIYWSDSSSQFDLFDGVFDVLADGSGRLVKYDRRTKKNTVLIDNLHFANGVTILNDQDAVLVAETVMSRVHRYDLSSGKHSIFIDRLPGIPDNIQADGKGNFWVPLVLAGDEHHPILFQFLGPYPNVRRYFARLFRFYELLAAKLNEFFPNPFFDNVIYYIGNFESMTFLRPKRLTIVRVTSEGKIKESLHSTNGKLYGISDAIVFNNHLYLGSPFNTYLGRVPLEMLDLKTIN